MKKVDDDISNTNIQPEQFSSSDHDGFLGGRQCNSRAYFISKKCNVPDVIRSGTSRIVSHISTNWAKGDLH